MAKTVVAAFALFATMATPAFAEDAQVSPGFQHLLDVAPDVVGRPIEAEHSGDHDQSTVVKTETGVMYWEPGLAPSWTNGYDRLTLDEFGEVVKWVGISLKPPVQPVLSVASVSGFGPFDLIKNCETPGRGWDANTGNGFEGGIQFLNSTWLANGGGAYAQHAYQATPWQQVDIGQKLLAKNSGHYYPWPRCRVILGLP